MAKVKAKKIKILKKDALHIVVNFIDKNCTMKIPKRFFFHRLEMGFYTIVEPDAKATI